MATPLVIDRRFASRIWDILVAECGAREDDRAMFVDSLPIRTQQQHSGEYRFMGALEFGGKLFFDVYDARRPLFVSCYPEDLNDQRRSMIAKANAALGQLAAGVR